LMTMRSPALMPSDSRPSAASRIRSNQSRVDSPTIGPFLTWPTKSGFGKRPETWNGRSASVSISLTSVARRLVDGIEQRLARLEPAEVVGEQGGGIGPVPRLEPGYVRRDQHVLTRPERTVRRERLVLEDVERRAAQPAV